MQRRKKFFSGKGKLVNIKLDPGVFVVEIPDKNRKISLGQPPDLIKRLQQVGYSGADGVTSFVLVDSKRQSDAVCWGLVEFPVLYALYYITVEKDGQMLPAFFAGLRPRLIGLERDVANAMAMIKYSNYGVDCLEEFDDMSIPEATKAALRKEIPGLKNGAELKESESFIDAVILDPSPRNEREFSDLGDGISIGRLSYNTYRIQFEDDFIDVDVTLTPDEVYRAPVHYRHFEFPVVDFGIWHTGEHDGMDPYFSGAHTTIIHNYEPILVDYPSNMTDVINYGGMSINSVKTVVLTHNHDDHMGAIVELLRTSVRIHIITTEPVQNSVTKKLAALVGLPREVVRASFDWTLLPFRRDNPYQTETLNLNGLQVTGHLSCHSVPTTVYTFEANCRGYSFNYGHFLDLAAFRRMEALVRDDWMPAGHLSHLDEVIRRTRYSLIKYDCGCVSDSELPFTIHAQWQDLIGSQTPPPLRVFSHAPRTQLSPAFEEEGRFASMGDLDVTILTDDGRTVTLGQGKAAITAFFCQAFQVAYDYFEDMLPQKPDAKQRELMKRYATAFAGCPTKHNFNLGTPLFRQGDPSDFAVFLVRGRAEVTARDTEGSRNWVVGDGEVLGDAGVLAGTPRSCSVKALNHLSCFEVPASLLNEAMNALGIEYGGWYSELYHRFLQLKHHRLLAAGVSRRELTRIVRVAEVREFAKGEVLFKSGERNGSLYLSPVDLVVASEDGEAVLSGPVVGGECEFFSEDDGRGVVRKHTLTVSAPCRIMVLDMALIRSVPVMVDNLRTMIQNRRVDVYRSLEALQPSF